jgi:TRAP-type mannitol/chloroaromatic compound transport system permease large subunit
MSLLKQALDNTTKLSCFVMFILIGSTVFSFTFNAADGQKWVEHLFDKLPGGALGFLIVVNLLVFVLGMFIDFFEIAFIVIPLLAPVAEKLLPGILPPGSDALIWFGVIIAMNLQTSFLTPPFGFALFYLRSVAAKGDYNDRVTNQRIPAVTTAQIYKGAIAFICIQLVMVVAVISWPGLVLDSLDKGAVVNIEDVNIEMPVDPDAEAKEQEQADAEAEAQGEKKAGEEGAKKEEGEEEDPAAALMRSMKK